MERLRNTTDDFESLIANGLPGGAMFNDVNFPIEDGLYWKDAGESVGDMAKMDDWGLTWMRVSDPNFPGKTFWGPNKSSNDITPEDINQGYIGNCWVMAAVSALAERDNRITKFMISD